jgi:hypothetical protein
VFHTIVGSATRHGTGSLLFLLFINDLPESTESDARLFVDDCLLFRPIRNNRDTQILQNDLNSMEEWENRWQVAFHPEKCVVMRVSNKRKPINARYTIQPAEAPIVVVGPSVSRYQDVDRGNSWLQIWLPVFVLSRLVGCFLSSMGPMLSRHIPRLVLLVLDMLLLWLKIRNLSYYVLRNPVFYWPWQ